MLTWTYIIVLHI